MTSVVAGVIEVEQNDDSVVVILEVWAHRRCRAVVVDEVYRVSTQFTCQFVQLMELNEYQGLKKYLDNVQSPTIMRLCRLGPKCLLLRALSHELLTINAPHIRRNLTHVPETICILSSRTRLS